MKTKLALMSLALALTARLCAQEVLTVAVFDFETKDPAVKDMGPKISALLNARLSANPQLITVERAELEKVLGEQELGLSGTVSADTAAKVGSLTGAKVLVTGSAFKIDKDLIILAKVIGTETSRVYGEMVTGGPSMSFSDLTAELAGKVAKVITEKGETLVAKVPSPAERIEAIRKSLGEARRPVLSIRITEQHFGGPTIDPAAQTELGKIAGECGFQLVDEKSDTKPEVEITGEALSQFGMRKGNLTLCKARVEIKVRDVATGNILLVDRETSVAVDLTEQTAAKTALQNAAAKLAERILPKVAR